MVEEHHPSGEAGTGRIARSRRRVRRTHRQNAAVGGFPVRGEGLPKGSSLAGGVRAKKGGLEREVDAVGRADRLPEYKGHFRTPEPLPAKREDDVWFTGLERSCSPATLGNRSAISRSHAWEGCQDPRRKGSRWPCQPFTSPSPRSWIRT